MNNAAIAAAYEQISAGYKALAEAYSDGESVHTATKNQTENTAVREGKAETGKTAKGTTKASADKEESPKVAKPELVKGNAKLSGEAAKAFKELQSLDLASASRGVMNPLAKALGMDTQGKPGDDIRQWLASYLASNGGNQSSSAKSQGSESEDESGQAESADDDEVEYPDLKTMKKEFRLFANGNQSQIEEAIDEMYFDADDDSDDPTKRLHQTLADEPTLRLQWKDNVWGMKQDGSWDAFVEQQSKK